MPHNLDIIYTLTLCLTFALFFGFITQKFKLSPIVGYLLAGIIVGPNSPGIVADTQTAQQFAEIGIILLMFGVGLHFNLNDLMEVKNIALPGAITQILITTTFSVLLTGLLEWDIAAGVVYGIAISVASTVVLTRVLSENNNLRTPTGHAAIGWLIVEDLFTIFVLVLLPVIFGSKNAESSLLYIFGITTLKLTVLVVFILAAGKYILPKILSYVAKTGARDLFTLLILVLALGMALAAAEFFGASMALGAFLAGVVVGQSDFSARAASEALPMRDAFAVLFFVSVGMLLDAPSAIQHWKLMIITLFIILIIKPLAAIVIVKTLKHSLQKALFLGAALGQIGEFSFILATLGITLGILPQSAGNAIILTSIISITLNPIVYKMVKPLLRYLSSIGIGVIQPQKENCLIVPPDKHRVIVVGYGPVGKTVTKILKFSGMEIVIIEMNFDTVKEIQNNDDSHILAIYGDAANREILIHAGIENSETLIIAAPSAPAEEITEIAKALNPKLRILVHRTYLNEAKKIRKLGIKDVFSGESAAALEISKFLLRETGIIDEELENECKRLNERLGE